MSQDVTDTLRLILDAARALPCTCRPVDQDGPAVQCEACLIRGLAAAALGVER